MERLLLLLSSLGVNSQNPPCSGSFLQENITLEVNLNTYLDPLLRLLQVGSPISIGCPLTNCPDKSSLTWQVGKFFWDPFFEPSIGSR